MAVSTLSGYQCNFVEAVEDYECPVCLHVTKNPSLTSCCGHHFCQGCIRKLLTTKKPCPLCKTTKYKIFLDKKQKRKVSRLSIYCTNKTLGCEWRGALNDLNTHLRTSAVSAALTECQFMTVDCLHHCGKKIMWKNMSAHTTNQCPKRLFSCQYCGLESTYKQITKKHIPACPKVPVTCPNQCETSPIERSQLEQHIEMCPLQTVHCDFENVGCEEVFFRKDAPNHLKESLQAHLMLMKDLSMDTAHYFNHMLRQLQRQLTSEQQEIDKLKHQVAFLKAHTPVDPSLKFAVTDFSSHKCNPNKRWIVRDVVVTGPLGYKLQVHLYFHATRLDIELWNIPWINDDNLSWPVKCSLTAKLCDFDHDSERCLERSSVLVIHRGSHSEVTSELAITYKKIKGHLRKNDTLRFEVYLRLV